MKKMLDVNKRARNKAIISSEAGMKKILSDMRLVEQKAQKELTAIRDKISAIETKINYPQLKKYIGKYFKYSNSDSLPKDESDYWFIYYHITSVNKNGEIRAFCFQTDKYGKTTFEQDRMHSAHLLQTEIDEAEFMAALSEIKNKLF